MSAIIISAIWGVVMMFSGIFIKEKLARGGYTAVGSGPEALAALLKFEIDKWGSIITEAGMRID